MRYIIYDISSGDIYSVFTGLQSNLVLNVPEGHDYIDHPGGDLSFQRVIDGQLVPFPEDERRAIDTSETTIKLRARRNELLKSTDWTQLPDSPLSQQQKTDYQVYRQELRDLPATYQDQTSIDQINFPEEP